MANPVVLDKLQVRVEEFLGVRGDQSASNESCLHFVTIAGLANRPKNIRIHLAVSHVRLYLLRFNSSGNFCDTAQKHIANVAHGVIKGATDREGRGGATLARPQGLRRNEVISISRRTKAGTPDHSRHRNRKNSDLSWKEDEDERFGVGGNIKRMIYTQSLLRSL